MEIKVEIPTPDPGIVSPLPSIPEPAIPTIPEIPDLTEITNLLNDPDMEGLVVVLNIAGVETKLEAQKVS